MVGWELLVKWKDESESWIKLSDLAELYAAEPVFYALLSMMVLVYIWKKVKLVPDGSIHELRRVE